MRGKTMLLLLAAVLAAAFLAGCSAKQEALPQAEEVPLTVHCFSAGKADAFLLYTENSAVLIDCGEKGFGKEIVGYCEENGIEKLDALIITHFDKDHVGGAAKVLKSLAVEAVYQSNSPKDSTEYSNYLEALSLAGIEARTLREDVSFALDGLIWQIDAPAEVSYADDPSNNSSLIVRVTDGTCGLLFMGDAEDARTEEYLAQDPSPAAFLKVPHHGRWQESLKTLIERICPQLAVVTSSEEEPEDAETLALLEEGGAQIVLTREGEADIFCDGQTVCLKECPQR